MYACIFYIDSFLLILILILSLHHKYIFIICALIVCSEIDIAINMYSSYTAFGDLEIFLHGLGLEHMTDLLKERNITLRHLLTMRKDEFTKPHEAVDTRISTYKTDIFYYLLVIATSMSHIIAIIIVIKFV
ncbi:hypothetical protein J1605_009692 [Eschrichtius robustus]|uniref:SAM domain-containing protein n=1 Tax=Eschrichtius robustus TaxID=9764 RepID=A0AB34GUE1_ESCRO|nr:hypothetical protein J1605_009692 [Eschrichtius robustus]